MRKIIILIIALGFVASEVFANGIPTSGESNPFIFKNNKTDYLSPNAENLPPVTVTASRIDDNPTNKASLKGLVSWLSDLMNQLIYLLIAVSLVVFLYGIFKLSFVDGLKPESREQARRFMFWGIVSLFVMVSVWGLVNILKTTLFGSGPLILPQLK